jgi:hypothetical protein
VRILLTSVLMSSVVLAHGVHASLASIQYVEESRSIEIVMVMSADDIETVLRRDTGKQIEVDRGAEQLVFGYMQKTLEFRSVSGAKVALRWVGMEVSVQKITAYLEAKVPDGPDGLRIRNDLLFDLLADQVNILSVKREVGGKPRASEHLFQAASKGMWQTVKLPATPRQ